MTRPHPRILPYGTAAIAEAAALIRDGGIVAVPTETVYGLAADATNAEAVARIYAAKGRPSFNPLIVHVADLAAAERIAVFDADARALAAAFWPGPLTLVLPVRGDSGIASLVTAGLATIAVRVPRHRAMQGLIAASGKPLAAPSANASGGISPTTAAHVAGSLGGNVPLILDDGATEAGLESTIVAGRTVLRPGPVTGEFITKHLPGEGRGPIGTSDVTGHSGHHDRPPIGPRPSPGRSGGAVTAPGQLESHYAPSKLLRLNATEAHSGEWLIGFGDVAGDITLSASGNLVEAAAKLFDLLHAADANESRKIAVAPIPLDGIGEAINDRLRRAAHR
ncbi:L-threonylcarbamoyladenylate synthase [Sphingomonas faeni]|uniref:L-threonylcarbamoyladenylate synthase n=1 Tax=Sphingomonas faeni TaxID=185950 RepID=UPI00277FAE3C|nr:L-threonylcarbamoyladenylate synthase [Sphingomonas faeni]MDQ0838884.1 tRNA threonylcarbamoyl adenosine modification protein (Sua5/YciO/YrdC/YwlC family) [Sphingomonas faeni]